MHAVSYLSPAKWGDLIKESALRRRGIIGSAKFGVDYNGVTGGRTIGSRHTPMRGTTPLNAAAELAQQSAHRWSKDDQAGDREHRDQRDDQPVLNQTLSPNSQL